MVAPVASADPDVIDTFAGGATSAAVTFGVRDWNDSVQLEIPRGARVTSAELTATGVMGPSVNFSTMDFSDGKVGADKWAMWRTGTAIHPPSLDPYKDAWTPIDPSFELPSLAAEDEDWWYTVTNAVLQPPWEYPIQVYQFVPGVAGAPAYEVVWNGAGECAVNDTYADQAEMWLYNHTSTDWDLMESYGSNDPDDVWLNVSIEAGGDYQASNGSIAVAIAGPHCIVDLISGNVDMGHLWTDYIAVLVNEPGRDEYPSDVNLTVGGSTLTLSTGPLEGPVVVGDALGLGTALQSFIDDHWVQPGNLTIALNLSVWRRTLASVVLDQLRVEYDPVVNGPPAWEGPASVNVTEDSPWTDVLLLEGAFTDDYNQDDLRFTVANVSDPAHLETRLNAQPNGTHMLAVRPAPDFFGPVALRIEAKDLFDAVGASEEFQVRVLQKPDAPVLVQPGPGQLQAMEETPFELAIAFTDVDLPDDSHTFSDNTDLFDIDPATGVIRWTPTGDQIGTHDVAITVTDRYGRKDTITITLTVKNVNDPPVITSDLEVEALQDSEYTYSILVADPDRPFGDIIFFTATSDDIEILVDQATGSITFTPGNGHYPGFDIRIAVEDKEGASDSATVHVTVVNLNDPPVLYDIGTQRIDQGDVVGVRLETSDPDLDIDLDPPEHLTLSVTGPDWLMPGADGWIRFTADQFTVGEHATTYTVTDREGLTDTISVLWIITNVNDVPVITNAPPAGGLAAREGERFTYAFLGEDLDGDALRWTDDSTILEIGIDTGIINFTPGQGHVGTHTVTVTASDGKGGKATVTFELVVENVNDAPVIRNITPINGTMYTEGDEVLFQVSADDEDGDALTYTWMEGGKQLGTGAQLRTSKLRPGRHTVTATVTDGTESVSRSVDVVVGAKAGGGSSLGYILGGVVAAVVVAVVVMLLVLRRRGRPPEEPPKPAPVAEVKTEEIQIEYRAS
jgi:hypothetical protein